VRAELEELLQVIAQLALSVAVGMAPFPGFRFMLLVVSDGYNRRTSYATTNSTKIPQNFDAFS
jgi:hypothetical protein